ncbi:MAG: hypothetical protein WCF56_04630, partial [Pseudolabrys sp.]
MAPNDMKAEELFRNVPANIHELYLALAGLPKDMEVKADAETGVPEKTVDELWARTTWPLGLVITTPRKLRPRSVLKISNQRNDAEPNRKGRTIFAAKQRL